MKLALILAASENNVIGAKNAMPWHLPSELKYFRQKTTGKPVVMGRKTFESIGMGKPLPNRHNIVISRSPKPVNYEGVSWVASIDEAIALAAKESPEEIMVIGGGTIYSSVLPKADRVYLTRIHATFDGDTYFEGFDEAQWCELSVIHNDKIEGEAYSYSCYIYDRLN